MKQLIYKGIIELGDGWEDDGVLYLNGDVLAEELDDVIGRKVVTVRYYVSDDECTIEDAVMNFDMKLEGVLDVEYDVAYSEYTGWLWTDEKLKVGGHDLLEELKSHEGKYLILIVDIHEEERLKDE